jgi:hypothetical protein
MRLRHEPIVHFSGICCESMQYDIDHEMIDRNGNLIFPCYRLNSGDELWISYCPYCGTKIRNA